jgi:hypothetical protein
MGEENAAVEEMIESAIGLLSSLVSSTSPARLSAAHYQQRVTRVEQIGRLVDALRVSHAAEAENRVASPVDSLGAAGYASAKHAVAQLTSISEPEAARRIRVGTALAEGVAISGAATSARYPAIAAAVSAGAMGLEAADLLVRELDAVARRVDPVVLHTAEQSLVDLASGSETAPPLRVELVRDQVKAFILAIDPDGARPTEVRARQQRKVNIGRETEDGLVPVSGLLTCEVGATLRRLLDAHSRRVAFPDYDTHTDEHTDDAPFVPADDRTPEQRRHDALADVLSAAVRVKDAPQLAGSSPAITVTVTAEALESHDGVGYIDGFATPVSIETIERLIDSRGMQTVTMNAAGRILALGSAQRCFTGAQRRAITARDGGCVIPGCTTPAGWCEVHHVIPWRNGGATHTDNGVLLCWGHHQRIDSGPWRLSMPDGVPHVRGPGHPEWTPTLQARTRRRLPRTG